MKYTRDEFFNAFGNKTWISPFEKIVILADKEKKLIEIFEKHPRGMATASWVTYHYPKASSLIINAISEGSQSFFKVKEGKCDLELKAGFSAAGIEEVRINKDTVDITYAGLGGGGVGAVLNRGLAEGVRSIEILDYGGGGGLSKAILSFDLKQKIVVGVDDTDTKEEGATWSLANEIAYTIEKEKHNEKDLKEILTSNPQIKFVSLMGIDLGGNATDEKIPVELFLEDINDFL